MICASSAADQLLVITTRPRTDFGCMTTEAHLTVENSHSAKDQLLNGIYSQLK